ncbi:glycosyltransferase family 4 protein [Alicyclobacillus fodiniaquatilis]
MHRRKRILFLDHQIFRGGGEVVVELLATELPADQYDVAVCGSPGSALESFCARKGILFFQLKLDRKLADRKYADGLRDTILSLMCMPLKLIRPILSLCQACKIFNPDIVHVHTLKCAILLVPIILFSKLRFNSSAFYVYHDHTLTSSIFHKIILRMFNTVICVSDSVRSKYRHSSGRRIQMIWNGISSDILNLKSKNPQVFLGLRGEAPIVVFSGRIVPWKGVHILIQAVAVLLNQGYKIHTIILGVNAHSSDLRYENTLYKLVSDYGLQEQISFLDFLPQDDAHSVIAGADIVVIPSVEPEPFGLAALEALALGRVVVGTNAGGLGDILKKWGGILTEPGDIDSLVLGMERALMVLRTQHIEERVSKGISICEACSSTKFVSKITNVYQSHNA